MSTKYCRAELHLADDHGDYIAIWCQLEEGHDGPHEEKFRVDEEDKNDGAHAVVIHWDGDDSVQEGP